LKRLFLRFVVLVLLSVSVATCVIYFAIDYLFGNPLEQIARRQASAQIFLLEQYVDKAPADEWLVRLNKVREVSDVQLELLPLAQARAALAPVMRAALERGEVVLDADHKALFRRVDLNGERYIGSADDVIHAQGLPIDIGLALQMEALRYVIVALALLIPIGFWSRGHWRCLQAMSRMADQFGAGQLSARARIAPGASLYPLAERINHMAGRIESLLATQQQLLHSVSHELRTPIARLEFGLELLRPQAPDARIEQRLDGMQGDLAELNLLVGELLTMGRLDSAPHLEHAEFELEPMLRDCVVELGQLEMTVDSAFEAGLGRIAGERRLLARAIGNLLRNAGKYAASRIAISARRRAGAFEIVVEDDGPGIPPAERERIFEPFYRLDRSRDRASGGFGLGLSIARKALALHGGTLHADASALGGARFIVTLPAQ
jgi:two-component system OmpR family sensor kinase